MAELIFDSELCNLCGSCVEGCPFGALELKNGRIEVNAACKLCRICVKKCPQKAVSLREEEPSRTVDKDEWKGIMVFVEQEEDGIHPVAYELIGKAKELAAKVGHPVFCLLIGGPEAEEQAGDLLSYGVNTVFVYANAELKHFRVDTYANVMEDCIRTVKPSVVLVGATALGRSLAPRCATRFRTGLTADCTRLEIKENTDLVQVRPAFGGNIMAQILTTDSRPQFATVRYKVMEKAKREPAPFGTVVSCPVKPGLLNSGIQVLETAFLEKVKGIEEEEILVVAGRGIKNQGDLAMIEGLAKALGGQLAVTRPLVEQGWADVTKQIGLSGRTVKPKLIITCGVSGAVQFAAGMNGAECIAAVNTDRDAPIFSIADYCITEDLYEMIPALTEQVLEYRKDQEGR